MNDHATPDPLSIDCPVATCRAPAGTGCAAPGAHHFARAVKAQALASGNSSDSG